jgi:hypothetical protein
MKPSLRLLTSLLFLVILTLPAANVWANVAYNAQIINKATLTYTGGTATASVTVTVALVPSLPNVTITNASGVYTAPDSPVLSDLVTITSKANGPADYIVVNPPSVLSSGNTTAPSVTGGATVNIGATVTTGASTTAYLTVPASGASGNNAVVNGIGAGTAIYFIGNATPYPRTVTSTVDNGDGTFRLILSAAIASTDVPGAGVQVGEQKTVSLSVKPGTVNTPGTDITVTVQAVVSTAGVGNVTAANTTPNTWTTASPPNVTLSKYVRNVTTSADNKGATHTYNSTTYYESGNVTAKPANPPITGDVLEYVLVANNTGAGAAALSAITDVLPTAYVTLLPNAYGAGKEVTYVNDLGAPTTYSSASDSDQATYTPGTSTLTVYIGTGATSSAGGSIPGGNKTVLVIYQVTVN